MEKVTFDILLIEDDPEDVMLTKDALNGASQVLFRLVYAGHLSQGLDLLQQQHFDLVLLDLNLPDCLGLETFRLLHTQAPHVPVLVLTGLQDEALALEAVQAGAQDYLVKRHLEGHSLSKIIRFAIERYRLQAALRKSEQHHRALIEHSNDAITTLAADGTILYESPSVFQMLKYLPEELIGNNALDFIHPDDQALCVELFQHLLQTPGAPISHEMRCKRKDGTWRWVIGTASNWLAEPAVQAVVINFHDFTERKRAEEQLEVSLHEKEILLKEIHHRVKNNMQIIASILNLQSGHTTDPATQEILRAGQNRVRSMALVHEQLYKSKNLARIDFRDYLQNFALTLFKSYRPDTNQINLTFDIKEVSLGVDAAIPCGLIVNELISNALKHAFPNNQAGEIVISLQPTIDGWLELGVKDNGIGFPVEKDWRQTESLGMQLVQSLTKQLNGTIELKRLTPGTHVAIRFKAESQK